MVKWQSSSAPAGHSGDRSLSSLAMIVMAGEHRNIKKMFEDRQHLVCFSHDAVGKIDLSAVYAVAVHSLT